MAGDYYTRFGLLFDPFAKSRKRKLVFESSEYLEARKRLDFLKLTKGIGILTGASGLGKTTVLRSWCSSLPGANYKVCYIAISTLSVTEFYRELSSELNLEPKFRKIDNFRQIQQEISRLHDEQKITPVIVIDEANHISSTILQDLKMIFNFEMDAENKAILILCGLPGLKGLLHQASQESLRQRIVMNYMMEPLPQTESREYIMKRLREAGGTEELMDTDAMNLIAAGAKGCLRMIDKLCSRSLLIGSVQGAGRVSKETVEMAVNDIEV